MALSTSEASPSGTYLAVCGIYRDEARYLREWVEFHRLVGVERFYLYDNGSEDDHREVLGPYVHQGVVHVTSWPGRPAQLAAYEDCLKRHRDEARWIAFLDVDEFLFSPTGHAVSTLLRDYERWPGVGVNWAVFGTSGHQVPPGGLVIESYLRRTSEPDFNRHIKTIANPARVRAFCKPSFFMYDEGLAVDENHRCITGPPWSVTASVSFERLRINHYTTRSATEYAAKVSRGWPDSSTPPSRFADERSMRRRLAAMDQLHDDAILRYAPALRRALARPPRASRDRPPSAPERIGAPIGTPPGREGI